MSLGIAFEGCAGRAAFHVGVVEALQEIGVEPAYVAGASSGSIVAAFLASGRQKTMTADWLAATGARVLRPEMILRGQWPWRMSDIVGEVLERAFGDLRLPELPLPVAIPVTLIERGQRRRRVLTRDDDERLVDAVLGSCFVPGPYSTTVRVQGRIAFDGAWLLRTPVDAAFSLGATRVLAVLGHARGRLKAGYPFGTDVPVPAHTRLLYPTSDLDLGGYDTDGGRVRAAIANGRETLMRFVDSNREWMTQSS